MNAIMTRVPSAVLTQECAYVMGASGWLSRAWRSARAAWRCARIAAGYGDPLWPEETEL